MPIEAFSDADELQPDGVESSDLRATLTSLFRAELIGARLGAVAATIAGAAHRDRRELLRVLSDALCDLDFVRWIEADTTRRQRALAIVKAIAPPDPGAPHNAAAGACFRRFDDWERYEHRIIIIPGYTPLDAKHAAPGIHPTAQKRLDIAVADHRAGKAPFLLVSGADVYPRGTPYFEALEMRAKLMAMGVAADRIFVDARARHTTTNLRNAGRIMRALGVSSALVVTKGGGVGGSDLFGQDFYLAHPTVSTFHGRCERELGYKIGELSGDGDGRIRFVPSPEVDTPGYDPLDP